MNKQQIIDRIRETTGEDISNGLRLKVVDYSGNPLAPEKTAYKLSWISQFDGKRTRCTYWPETVGMQGIK